MIRNWIGTLAGVGLAAAVVLGGISLERTPTTQAQTGQETPEEMTPADPAEPGRGHDCQQGPGFGRGGPAAFGGAAAPNFSFGGPGVFGGAADSSFAPGERGTRADAASHRHGGGERAMVAGLIGITADQTGLTPTQVRAELKNGQSLAQVASNNGSSGAAVVQVALDEAQMRLDDAVANGRITQERADEMRTRIEERLNEIVNDTELGQQIAEAEERMLERQSRRVLHRATATETGLTNREVAQRVRGGESLAAIAQTEGATVNTVISAAETLMQERLTQAVDAGIITQQEANEALQTFRDMAPQMMEETR